MAALVREKKSLRDKRQLLQRQDILTQEFEHRLSNSLQLIVGLLSLQSSAGTTLEAAEQLTIAAKRVTALGRVHQRLHLLDHQRNVQFKRYLQDLCGDLSDLLLQERVGRVVVSGTNVKLATALGIPLGFIVSELITNSAKYAKGDITVRMEKSAFGHSLSVSDEGPGLPAAYDPGRSKGLGMKIIQTLVKQIGGELQFAPGDGGRGTRVTVAFSAAAVS
jgi:two-component sensor histidine kinase